MKILRIKLVNFIGIMHGMGTGEIEIDFTRGKNKIIMFRGKNGSGKSTIVGALTPFKQNTDNREQLILDGLDGRKEIDYEHRGHIYKIIHTYPAKGTSQSFISKDGIELNENGGVKTCEDIIEKEFGITKDYFKIGKIGSNTKNFVDFTAADRKKYIGTFLDIDDMLAAYKTVNDKLKVLKKDVISIANELKTYEPKEVVETRIAQLKSDIDSCENNLKEQYPQQGKYQEKINKINLDISKYDVPALQQREREKSNDVLTNRNTKDRLSKLIDTAHAEENKEKLQQEVSVLQGDIRVNDANKQSKNALIVDYQNKITGTELELKGLGNPEDIEKYNAEMAKEKEKLEELRKSLSTNQFGELVHNLQKEGKNINRYLSRFSEFASFIEKFYTNLAEKFITTTHTNLEEFMNDNAEDSFHRQIKASRDVIAAKEALLRNQERELMQYESHRTQAAVLEKRPKECTINNCPFIAEALKFGNIEGKIAEKKTAVSQAEKDIEILKIKADKLTEVFDLYRSFIASYTNAVPRDNPILAKFCEEKTLAEWVAGNLSEFQRRKNEYIDGVKLALEDLDAFRTISIEYKNNEAAKKVYENSDQTIKQKYIKDIDDNKASLERVRADYQTLDAAGAEIRKKLEEKQTQLNMYDEYITACSKYDSATKMLATAQADLKQVADYKAELSLNADLLRSVNEHIQTLVKTKNDKTVEYNNSIAILSQINSLNKKLENLKVVYKPTDTIAKSLSPTSGIPLVLIKMYLGETEKIANELLDVAYGGDFKIKFVTTEKEFAIQVATKGNSDLKADISLASQGEIALTTISISLALIEQSIGEYNILCLDEIDGPLDSDNRENFIDILNSQIEKLGIEQVFVISHNNAFDTCPLDLVLLKNSDVDTSNASYMENKSIIFDYNELS